MLWVERLATEKARAYWRVVRSPTRQDKVPTCSRKCGEELICGVGLTSGKVY